MANKISKSEELSNYLNALSHPLAKVVNQLRTIISQSSNQLAEEIKWNAPSFYYTGPLPPSNPKDYTKYVVVFNLSRTDCVRLIFLKAAYITDDSGLLEGNYTDGRRIITFTSTEGVQASETELKNIILKCIEHLKTI